MVDATKPAVRLLLVGRTGDGKSATGNSLLHGIFFESKISRKGETKKSNWQKSIRNGKVIEVVDTPGFCDSTMDNFEVTKELNRAMMMSTPGFHAIAFVIRGDVRFTEEYLELVDLFFKFFGEDVEKFAFVIFTHTNSQSDLSEFLTDEKYTDDHYIHPGFKDFIHNKVCVPKLTELLKRCKGNITIINNKANLEILERQTEAIFEEIENIKHSNSQAYFQNTQFYAIEAALYAYTHNCKSKEMREYFARFEENRKSHKDFIAEPKVTGTGTDEDTRNEFKSMAQNDDSFLKMVTNAIGYFVDRMVAFGGKVKSLFVRK